MARMREIAAIIVIILISITSTTANKRLDLDLYGESASPRNGRELFEKSRLKSRFYKPNGSRCKRRFNTRLNSCLKCENLAFISDEAQVKCGTKGFDSVAANVG